MGVSVFKSNQTLAPLADVRSLICHLPLHIRKKADLALDAAHPCRGSARRRYRCAWRSRLRVCPFGRNDPAQAFTGRHVKRLTIEDEAGHIAPLWKALRAHLGPRSFTLNRMETVAARRRSRA